MLSSIHPLGERGKGNRFFLTASSFVGGAVLGGSATGTIAGVLGLSLRWLPHPGALAAVGVAALVAAWFERSGARLPSLPRQVDENWLNEYRGWVYGAGFGFQLGTGVLTYITSAAVYVVLLAAMLVGSPAAAIAIGLTFGITRGLTIVPARFIRTPGSLVRFHQRLDRSAAAVRLASTSILLAAALIGVAASLQELS